MDILEDRTALFSKIEDAAQSRYASGTGMQEEVIMAQTEKYMILEKEEMQRQRIQALQGMLNTTVGREVSAPLGRPALPPATPFSATLEEVVGMAKEHSPDVRSKQKMVEEAEAKVKLARKEYYPGFRRRRGLLPQARRLSPICGTSPSRSTCPSIYKTKQSRPWPRRRRVSRRPSGSWRQRS